MNILTPEIDFESIDGFTNEHDIFQRKEFGSQLTNLVKNTSENLVLALDSKWGEGKSTFIKMWHKEIKTREPEIKTIYFDAFENDYQQDPFLAIASEIYELLEDHDFDTKKQFKTKAAHVAKVFTRGMIKIGVKAITAGALDIDELQDVKDDVSELVSDQIDAAIESKLSNSKADKLALQNFKIFLSQLIKESTDCKKLIFIIDELDRCRPDFALDLLEKIKHLFSVPGITFLLVMNKRQLEESVKLRYGAGIDSSNYLQKFINIWLSLPRETGDGYNLDHGSVYFKYCINKMQDTKPINNTETQNTLNKLIMITQPSFRDIERIATQFAIYENLVESKNNTYYQLISAFVCYMRVTNQELFDKLINGQIGVNEVSEILHNKSKNRDISDLDIILKFVDIDLCTDETLQKQKIAENHLERVFFGRAPTKVTYKINNLLSNFKLLR